MRLKRLFAVPVAQARRNAAAVSYPVRVWECSPQRQEVFVYVLCVSR